jgi:trk system potassium uptake protein TrkH
MFLAGINFQLYYRMVGGDRSAPFRDHEFRTYVVLVVVAIVLVSFSILHRYGFPDALRHGAFQVISIQTTTGFGTDDFNVYPPFAKILLVGLMFIGGSAGSTAGGMKISRFIVVFKAISNELYRTFRPHAVFSVKIGRQAVPDDVVKGVLTFFCFFIVLFFFGSLFLSMFGIDIVTSATATIAALGNIGPGLERVGSIENYAFVPPPGKILLAIFMIVGRLEILTILVLVLPGFWRK